MGRGWGFYEGGSHLQPCDRVLESFYGHHRGYLNNPFFLNLGVCAACCAHFMCHQELWPIWQVNLKGALIFSCDQAALWMVFSVRLSVTDGFEMMHKAWCSIEEVPYCFPRSSIKFHGHTGQKIADFYPNWAFPDCNFSFNSPMDLKWCTKLDVV